MQPPALTCDGSLVYSYSSNSCINYVYSTDGSLAPTTSDGSPAPYHTMAPTAAPCPNGSAVDGVVGFHVSEGTDHCTVTQSGGCIQSLDYGNNQNCSFFILGMENQTMSVISESFSTERSHDVLWASRSGYYSGDLAISESVYNCDAFWWSSDHSIPADGWKICIAVNASSNSDMYFDFDTLAYALCPGGYKCDGSIKRKCGRNEYAAVGSTDCSSCGLPYYPNTAITDCEFDVTGATASFCTLGALFVCGIIRLVWPYRQSRWTERCSSRPLIPSCVLATSLSIGLSTFLMLCAPQDAIHVGMLVGMCVGMCVSVCCFYSLIVRCYGVTTMHYPHDDDAEHDEESNLGPEWSAVSLMCPMSLLWLISVCFVLAELDNNGTYWRGYFWLTVTLPVVLIILFFLLPYSEWKEDQMMAQMTLRVAELTELPAQLIQGCTELASEVENWNSLEELQRLTRELQSFISLESTDNDLTEICTGDKIEQLRSCAREALSGASVALAHGLYRRQQAQDSLVRNADFHGETITILLQGGQWPDNTVQVVSASRLPTRFICCEF